jgi:outer membrane murein-binding lipoprotein Lpp
VLRSPIPFRFGINLTGNFDDWKIRLSKAKYKNENVPVFTKQLDTMQVNLVNSIHNIFQRGVEAALAQNTAAKNDVAQAKDKAGYTDELPEPLDSARQVILDSLLYAFDHPEDSTLSARLDSLTSSADSISHDDAASKTAGTAPVIGAASAMNVSGTPAHPSGNEAADRRRQLILAPEKEDDKR